MKQELREQLGKAVYAEESKERKERTGIDTIPWEYISEISKEVRRREAEAAVSTFVASIMPAAQNFVQSILPVCTPEQREQIDSAIETIKRVVEE